MTMKIEGLVAATFTPMNADESINIGQIEPITEHLINSGVNGLYICGSTGEGPSLSIAERKAVAEEYIKVVSKRVPVIVQVGHDSLVEAAGLAKHAELIGADAIASITPNFFKPESLEVLINSLGRITDAAPNVPFFYYHLPGVTGVQFDMVDFLKQAPERIRSLAGIKYSALDVHGIQACLNYDGGKYTIFFGCDEMLGCGLFIDVPGAVGTTFNFAAPLYNAIIDAFKSGNMEKARELQLISVNIVRACCKFRGQAGFKAVMKMIGLDCGPNRLPVQTCDADEIRALESELRTTGLFDWVR